MFCFNLQPYIKKHKCNTRGILLWFSYFSFNVYPTLFLATTIICKLARSCRKIIKYSKKVGSRVVFPHAFSEKGAHTKQPEGRWAKSTI